MINLVAPYIKYGVPTLQTLRDLIQKRGYTKIEDKKIPLTDNQVPNSLPAPSAPSYPFTAIVSIFSS